ncbi:MAG: hypothetical protein WC900_02565 [Oscillospiraceae bacterium]|jgi:Ca2+/Na+ antiporter
MEEIIQNPIAEVVYNITNQEEDVAFRAFQKKYVYKKSVIHTVLFSLIAALFLYQGLVDTSYTLAWVMAGICAAFIFFCWYNPHKIRKSLLEALLELEDDKYCLKLYDEYFSIKTILNDDEIDAEENEPEDIPPRIVTFEKDPVEVIENENQFILIMKKQTIYTFPKRCMDGDTVLRISGFFKEKLGDRYELSPT